MLGTFGMLGLRLMAAEPGNDAGGGPGTAGAPAGGGGGTGAPGGGDAGNAPQNGASGVPAEGGEGDKGDKGDEGLDPGASLIGGGGDGGKPADGGQKAGEPAPPADPAPVLSDEEYAGKIAFTEDMGKDEKGEAVKVNGEFVKPFVPVLKEFGLSPEQASKLVTLYAKIERAQGEKAREAAEDAEKEAREALLKKRDELRAESKKALGEADLAFANRAMDYIKKDDPVFYKMVQTSLLGVHKGFLQLCAMAGRRIADDGLPNPSGFGGGARKTPGELLFGDAIKAGEAVL